MELIKNYADLITLHVDGELFKREMTVDHHLFKDEGERSEESRIYGVFEIVRSLFRSLSISTGYKRDYYIGAKHQKQIDSDMVEIAMILLAIGGHLIKEDGQPQLMLMLNRLSLQIEDVPQEEAAF